MSKNKIVEITEDQVRNLIDLIISLGIDCSDHLQKEHGQENPNDKPRFFFDNIVKQARELREEILGE